VSQPLLFETTPHWSVSELTRYMRQLLESDSSLQDVWVKGEISNFSKPSSGHIYFTLKDAGASLRCVIWKSDALRLRMALQDGLSVEAHGNVSIYEPGGQYQLYINVVKPLGEGTLYQEFLRLKALLEADGLFDPARKRAIPPWPKQIGIVTSPTGAALRDMLNILRRRLPLAKVILAPSPVQGDEAPSALVAALSSLNNFAHPDVILIARGGGSIEDLWAFNDERVVRAVAASPVPVISGVGHETDFTLTDFAADLRAPTPTAAAELATPIPVSDLQDALSAHAANLNASIIDLVDHQREEMRQFEARLRFFSPLRRINDDRQRLDEFSRRTRAALDHRFELSQTRVKGLDHRLDALNPLSVLARGYAMVTRLSDGKLVHSAQQVEAGDELTIRVADGDFGVEVSSKK
jgi:exodeoxyribonuclease VII large subunit